MTLVMLACVPLLAGFGLAFTLLFTKTQARGESAYATASGLVQEALSSIRTVFAFSAESRMQARYAKVCALPVCRPTTVPQAHLMPAMVHRFFGLQPVCCAGVHAEGQKHGEADLGMGRFQKPLPAGSDALGAMIMYWLTEGRSQVIGSAVQLHDQL